MNVAIRYIQENQINDIQGLSQYYTVNMQITKFVNYFDTTKDNNADLAK